MAILLVNEFQNKAKNPVAKRSAISLKCNSDSSKTISLMIAKRIVFTDFFCQWKKQHQE
jgi:hypothetical protein